MGAGMKHCIETYLNGLAAIAFLIILSSCTIAPKSHLGDKAIEEELIELKSTEVNKIWFTNDLSIYYSLLDQRNFFDINGFVEISTSVTYTFPSPIISISMSTFSTLRAWPPADTVSVPSFPPTIHFRKKQLSALPCPKTRRQLT